MINRAEHHHEADVLYLFLDLEKSQKKKGFFIYTKFVFTVYEANIRFQKTSASVMMFSSFYHLFIFFFHVFSFFYNYLPIFPETI